MPSNRKFMIIGTLVIIALAVLVSPFASSSPDGLEKVAEEHGIEAAEHATWSRSPIPDYLLPGIGDEGLATALAGAIGTLGVLGLGLLIERILVRRSPRTA